MSGSPNERRRRSSCRRDDRRGWPRRPCAPRRLGSDTRRTTSLLRDEETRLHARLLDRDESALLECLERFGHIVYCTSLAESGDSHVAETVTHRVFLQLWRRPEAFHPRCGPLVLQLVRATFRPSAV